MQPMGHVQLIRNLLDNHMDPQQACDAPRWYLKGTGVTQSSNDMSSNEILLEDGFGEKHDGGKEGDQSVAEALTAKGHKVGAPVVGYTRTAQYGRAQVILKNPKTGVLWGGSDPRADGCAIPFV